MARNILLVEQSSSMREILSSMILPHINDARVIEAETVAQAEKKLEENDCHLVLFVCWDVNNSEWLDFFEKTKHTEGSHSIPFILLSSKEQEEYIQQASEFGISEHIALPCQPKEMVDMINRVCDPIQMRSANRYSIANTSVLLAQGEKRWDGQLVNISSGGMLCDIECPEDLKWENPFMATLFFHDYDDTTINGLYSIMKCLRVNDTHPDFTPKNIRCAFLFLTVPKEEKSILESIFQQEKKKKI